VDVSLGAFYLGGVCGWGPSFGGSASSLLVAAYGCMLRGEERGKRTRICFASAWILWGRRLRVLGEVHLFVCFLFKEDKSGGEGSRICRT